MTTLYVISIDMNCKKYYQMILMSSFSLDLINLVIIVFVNQQHRNQQPELHEIHNKLLVVSGASKECEDPSSHVAPFVLLISRLHWEKLMNQRLSILSKMHSPFFKFLTEMF